MTSSNAAKLVIIFKLQVLVKIFFIIRWRPIGCPRQTRKETGGGWVRDGDRQPCAGRPACGECRKPPTTGSPAPAAGGGGETGFAGGATGRGGRRRAAGQGGRARENRPLRLALTRPPERGGLLSGGGGMTPVILYGGGAQSGYKCELTLQM